MRTTTKKKKGLVAARRSRGLGRDCRELATPPRTGLPRAALPALPSAATPRANVHRHAKFHPQSPGKAVLPTENSGCDSAPLTADLGAMSTPGARAATNDLICSLVPGSCLPRHTRSGGCPGQRARGAAAQTQHTDANEAGVSGELHLLGPRRNSQALARMQLRQGDGSQKQPHHPEGRDKTYIPNALHGTATTARESAPYLANRSFIIW